MRKKSAKNSAPANNSFFSKKTIEEEIDAAKQYCLKLLRIQERTATELQARLSKKEYPSDVIAAALQALSSVGLVDDKKFACRWIEKRIADRYGKDRIIFELKQKGIPDEVIQQGLASGLVDYDENQAAKEEAEKFKRSYITLQPPDLLRRLSGHLMRKGFSEDIVREIIDHYDNE